MPSAERVPLAALTLLLQRGFDATSVEELAEAAGVSRSTFFRRFGSKEEMVFADLEERVAAARSALVSHRSEGALAMVPAALAVFDHATADPAPARVRWELLHAVPALREKELVSTHRFERLFRDHLLALSRARTGRADATKDATEPAAGRPGADAPAPTVRRPTSERTNAVALASAVVAVHNDHLRSWLREPGEDVRPALASALRTLITEHGPEQGGSRRTRGSAPTVVVLKGTDTDPAAVAQAVEAALREQDQCD